MQREQELDEAVQPVGSAWPPWAGRAGAAFLGVALLLTIDRAIVATAPLIGIASLIVLALVGTALFVRCLLYETSQADTLMQQGLAERDERWRALLDEYATGLPILNQQLNETAQQVERAVVDICNAFSGMASRAQASVDQSAANLHSGGEQSNSQAGLQDLIDAARTTLVSVLDRIIQSSTYSMRLVYRMEDVEQGMQEISSALREIEQIARRTKLLALNTTIEAARFSGQSKGFAVVAAEITRLAERTTHASETIRGLVCKVNDDVHCACEDLRELASTDMSGTVLSQEQVERTLTVLNSKNEAMRSSVERAMHNSQALAEDISRAVIRLQFQDTVSQRIGHVVAALQEMQETFGEVLANEIDSIPPQETAQSWTERMQRQYTMASERQVLTEQGSASGKTAVNNNVELF